MNIIRTPEWISIEIEEDNDGIELNPTTGVFRGHYGFWNFELRSDQLRFFLGTMEFHLARLATAALDAERLAKETGRKRYLVYNHTEGTAYETFREVEGGWSVEYLDGRFVWQEVKNDHC